MKYYNVSALIIPDKSSIFMKRAFSFLSSAAEEHIPDLTMFEDPVANKLLADFTFLVNVKKYKKYEALFLVAYTNLVTKWNMWYNDIYSGIYDTNKTTALKEDLMDMAYSDNIQHYLLMMTAIKLFGNNYIDIDLMSYDDMMRTFVLYGNQFKNIKPFTTSQRNWEYGTNLYELSVISAIRNKLKLRDDGQNVIPKRLQNEIKNIALIWN